MADLIDRNALIKEIQDHIEKERTKCNQTVDLDLDELVVKYNHGEYCYVNALHLVRSQPTVETKSVEWIPCSEKLPNCNGCYLVWRPHFFGGEIGMPAICYFDGQNTWHDSYGVDFTRILNEKDVIAWMPLPEPYKEGGVNERNM